MGQGYGERAPAEKEKLADLLVAKGVRRPLASKLRRKSRYADGGVIGVFMLAWFRSAWRKPGVGAGVCRAEGNVAECGVGKGDGRGFVEVAAAMAFADADATSEDVAAMDVAIGEGEEIDVPVALCACV